MKKKKKADAKGFLKKISLDPQSPPPSTTPPHQISDAPSSPLNSDPNPPLTSGFETQATGNPTSVSKTASALHSSPKTTSQPTKETSVLHHDAILTQNDGSGPLESTLTKEKFLSETMAVSPTSSPAPLVTTLNKSSFATVAGGINDVSLSHNLTPVTHYDVNRDNPNVAIRDLRNEMAEMKLLLKQMYNAGRVDNIGNEVNSTSENAGIKGDSTIVANKNGMVAVVENENAEFVVNAEDAGLDGHFAANVVDGLDGHYAANVDGLDGHYAANVTVNEAAGSAVVKKVSFADIVTKAVGTRQEDISERSNIVNKMEGRRGEDNRVGEDFPPLPQRNVSGGSIQKGIPPLISVLNPNQQKPNRSFLDIMTADKVNKLFQVTTFQGAPAVIVSREDESQLAAPFKYTLVGKFVKQRPPMERIRKLFVTLNLKAAVQVQHIDFRHVLIVLHSEEDYSRVWARKSYSIEGRAMRLFKWSPRFHPTEESPVVPVWVAFPDLPIHFSKNKEYVQSLASVIGTPLRMDLSTAAGTKPALARALVEVDVTKEQIQRIRCGSVDYSYWQPIIYENVPDFCDACKHLGHREAVCYVKDPNKLPPHLIKQSRQHAEEVSQDVAVNNTEKELHKNANKLVGRSIEKGMEVPVKTALASIRDALSSPHNKDLNSENTLPTKEPDRTSVPTNKTTSDIKWSATDEEYDGEVEIEFTNGDSLVLPSIGMLKHMDQSKVTEVRQFQGNKQGSIAPITIDEEQIINAENHASPVAGKIAEVSRSPNTEIERTGAIELDVHLSQTTGKRVNKVNQFATFVPTTTAVHPHEPAAGELFIGAHQEHLPISTFVKASTSTRRGFKMKSDRTLRSRVTRSQSINWFDNLNCHSDGDDFHRYETDSYGEDY